MPLFQFFLMSANDTINYSEIEGIKIDGFIQKPIRIKEFLSILEKHLINIKYHECIVNINGKNF
jgi:hypothetical protein